MNILPKKSWHVLSKVNIDRVRKDEAEAKAQEEEKQQRAEIAEREARLELMRKRARQREGYDDVASSGEPVEPKSKEKEETADATRKHINFFQDVGKGVGLQSTNVEHDAEQKAEQEKLEKRIGLLNYLVDKDKSEDPWYIRHQGSEESAKSRRRKERMDPLNDMKHFVEAKKKCLEVPERPPLLPSVSYQKSASSGGHGHSVEKPEHKEKHKKHHKHKSKSKRSKEKEEERERLEELRRKRRQREEAERTRTEAMLRQHHGEGGKDGGRSAPQMVEEMPGRYNSQFNPHLARH